MADGERLVTYIGQAITAGRDKDSLRAELMSEGWTDRETGAALAAWSDAAGPAGAIPRPVRSTAARDALFHALLFVAFGMVAAQVTALLFGQIDLHLADPASPPQSGTRGLRWSMAALIVFAPTFWLLDRTDRRRIQADPAQRHVGARRWLGSFALLIAAITLLGDALGLIYTYLDGMLTSRFLAKSLAVALLSALVLGYFRQDRWRLVATTGLFALAAVTLVLAFSSSGGPNQGRIEARDRARLDDLRTLSWNVRSCLVNKAALPETLDPLSCAENPEDLTAMARDVRYTRLGDTRYSLCLTVEQPDRVRRGDIDVRGADACIDITRD